MMINGLLNRVAVALGIFVRSVKVVTDRYDYGPTAFLLAMLAGGLDPLGPDWLAKEFGKNARTLGIAYALTIFSSFLPSFWAGDDIHCRVQENIDTLASIYKGHNHSTCLVVKNETKRNICM